MTDEALASALRAVAAAMAGAQAPWWIIGSAAVCLHGAATSVADVDLLLDPADAPAFAAATGTALAPGVASDRFRSALFGRWARDGLPVEAMADLHVHDGEGWAPVRLVTREAVQVGGATVHVPVRAELAMLLHRFGRDKDLRRAVLLE